MGWSESTAPGDPGLDDTPQKRRIRHIAAGLFAQKGYHAVGIAEIGNAVGLGRGALYHYISSKEQLLYEIASKYIHDIVVEGNETTAHVADPEHRIHLLSRQLLKAIATNKAEMTVCFREFRSLSAERRRIVSNMHTQYEQLWSECVSDGTLLGIFRNTSQVELKGLLGMYFYSFLWLGSGTIDLDSHENVADQLADVALRALRV